MGDDDDSTEPVRLDLEEALPRLRSNDGTLTHLSLVRKEIGEEGARALADALKENTSLTRLELRWNEIGEEGARALADALKENTSLAHLGLGWNEIGEEGARVLADALKENTSLAHLDLGINKIGDEGARALANALKENASLAHLGLGINKIGDEGARALADALKENTFLAHLDLRRNKIGDEGARALADALKENTSLALLDLRGSNKIGDEGARALADALKENTSLAHLGLGSNKIGNEGARALADALKENVSLTHLDLGDNIIGDEGARALADALKENTFLAHLGLGSNGIGDEGARALADGLKGSTNTTLTYLNLDDNEIGDEGADAKEYISGWWLSGNELLQLHRDGVKKEGFDFYFGKNVVGGGTDSLRVEESVWKAAGTFDGLVLGLVRDVLRKHLDGYSGDALKSKKESLKKLFDEARNPEGSLLLHLAAGLESEGALTLCQCLVEEIGVDFDAITDQAGRTAREIAKGNANAEMSKWAKSDGTFLGRYVIEERRKYRSATCTVHFAVDQRKPEGDPDRNVAIMIMENPEQFERELNMKLRDGPRPGSGVDIEEARSGFDEGHGVPLLRYHEAEFGGTFYRCLVMPTCRRRANEVETISLYDLIPHEEIMQTVTSHLEESRTSPLLLDIVKQAGDGDDAAARRLNQMREDDRIRDVIEGIQRAATRKEIIDAVREGGVCPLRQGRVTLVGRGRSGKTSLLRAFQGKVHDGAEKSTVGLDTLDADVRDIGVDIRGMAVEEELYEPWIAVSKEKNSTEGAIRKHAARSVSKVDTLKSWETTSGSEALENLLKKYGLGKDLEEQEEEIPNRKQLLPSRSNASGQKDQSAMDNPKSAQSKSEEESLEQSSTTIREEHDATLTPNSPGTRGHSYNEKEENVARRHEVNVKEDDGNLLRLLVWDYGGQDVFRIILNMYLPRNCCYIVVFRAIDLLDDKTRDGAIDDLNDWLQAINTHATCRESQLTGDAAQHRAIRSAPVLLACTHFDHIKTDPDCDKKLARINNVLKQKFQYNDSVQTSKANRIDGREFLYNTEKDLCFWPVDNTDSTDANIRTLRHLIVKAIKEDKAAYLEDPIPLPWLDVLERLSKISEDEPLLPIYSKDSSEHSVVSLMRQAGALDSFDASIGVEEKVKAEKRRAVALLQFFHQLGALVYFDSVPVLQHHCILDPQWLMDTMTYVVRDFKLHRFRRDYKAMELDKGDQWKKLITKGILEGSLLRQFWLGEDENHEFLIHLMMKIGVFAPLLPSKDSGLHRYLVPSVLSSAGTVSSLKGSEMEIHPLFDPVHEGKHSHESIDFNGFLPRGFYERSVARLVGDWVKGYEDYDPVIFPGISHLVMGSQNYPFTLRCYHDGKIDLITADIKHMEFLLPHVKHAMDEVNTEIHGERLSIVYPSDSARNEPKLRQQPSQRDVLQVQMIGASTMKHNAKEEDYPYINLVSFFTENKMSSSKAEKLSRLIRQDDEDKDSLIEMYQIETSDGFRECLQEMGINKRADQSRIIAVLKDCPKPPEKKQYLVGFFGGENLDFVHKERDMIPRLLAPSGLQATFHDMGPLGVIDKTNDNESQILHFAMHGDAKTRTGWRTLAFSGSSPDDLVEPDLLAKTIASCCAREDGHQSGSVQLVVFNACRSYGIARLLKGSQHQVPWVISWKTTVNDEAALTFAEGLYHFLGKNSDNCENFANAFERASIALELRGWLIDKDGGDPKGPGEKLRQRQIRERNPALKPAGIPRLHRPSKDWVDRMKQKGQTPLTKEHFDARVDELKKVTMDIPRFICEHASINCPYLYIILGPEDYASFYDEEHKKSSSVADINEQLWVNKMRKQVSRASRCAFGGKKKTVYLQLLCGRSLEPVITYKVSDTTYGESIEKLAKAGNELCAIGIELLRICKYVPEVAKAVGAATKISDDVLTGLQSTLQGVNEESGIGSPRSSHKVDMSGDDLRSLEGLLAKLDGKGKVVHCLGEFGVKKKKRKKVDYGRLDKTWADVLDKDLWKVDGKQHTVYVSRKSQTITTGQARVSTS